MVSISKLVQLRLNEIFQKFDGKFNGKKSHGIPDNYLVNNNPENYNLSKLVKLSRGNIHFTIEMLQIYLQNADKDISELKASCVVSNWDRAGCMAHKLIPACSYLQLNKLVRHLKDIETNAKKNQDPDTLVKQVKQVCTAYNQVRPLIISELNKLKKDKLLRKC